MSLRMGEDTPATILLLRLLLSSSLSFFPYHFPPSALTTPSDHHYMYHFSAPLFFPWTTCLLLSHTYSITSFWHLCCHLSPSPPLRAAMLSYNLDNAGCCVCLSFLKGQVQRLGAHPTCCPAWERQRDKNDKRSPGKYMFVEPGCNWSRNKIAAPSWKCLDFQGGEFRSGWEWGKKMACGGAANQ